MPTQSKFPTPDPAIVPVEGPADTADNGSAARPFGATGDSSRQADSSDRIAPNTEAPYGQNNAQLPERLQEALRRAVFQFSTESELSRRQEIRRIKQAHQFWRGLQYLWWDERDQNWHLPFEQKSEKGRI